MSKSDKPIGVYKPPHNKPEVMRPNPNKARLVLIITDRKLDYETFKSMDSEEKFALKTLIVENVYEDSEVVLRFPGGRIEEGENEHQTASREFVEETSLIILADDEGYKLTTRYRNRIDNDAKNNMAEILRKHGKKFVVHEEKHDETYILLFVECNNLPIPNPRPNEIFAVEYTAIGQILNKLQYTDNKILLELCD